MNTFYLLLLILAAILFAASAIGVSHPKLNLISLGLLCWVLVPLIQTAKAL